MSVRGVRMTGTVLAAAACALLASVPEAGAAPTRYSLVHGCYALKSSATGKYVAKAASGGYEASAPGLAQAEGFRMQATDLGRYLLYTRARGFLTAESVPLVAPVDAANGPSESGNWVVDQADSAFRLTLPD